MVDLAAQSGVRLSTLRAALYQPGRRLSAETAIHLARALKITADELVDDNFRAGIDNRQEGIVMSSVSTPERYQRMRDENPHAVYNKQIVARMIFASRYGASDPVDHDQLTAIMGELKSDNYLVEDIEKLLQ